MTIFLFHGQEEFLIKKEIKKLKTELLDVSFISMAYKVFDNPDFNTLSDCLQSPPLMFGNTLNLIYFEKYLTGNKFVFDDKQIESIDFALKSIPDSVNIIFVCEIPRDENKKIDGRKKLYKTISKYAQVKEFPQFRTYSKELPPEIIKMAKEKGLTINTDNVGILINQTGANLTLIDSELEKLKTAIHPEKTIKKEDIYRYCTSTEDIFKLADLILEGNKNEILKQYELLTEKRHPLEIFAILQKNFQQFIFIKNYEKTLGVKDIAQKLHIFNDYVVTKTIEKLRNTSLEELTKIRKRLINAEFKIKTEQSSISEIVLEMAILS